MVPQIVTVCFVHLHFIPMQLVIIMLANHNHLCGGSTAPSQALMVCTQQDCNSFALCCIGKNCDCSASHEDHHMVKIGSVLKKTTEPVRLPEQYGKMEKDINIVLDELIKELQQLKDKHHVHVKKHVEKMFGCGALLRKLAQKEPLELKEATGDCFHRLLEALGKAGQVESPYPASLETQLAAIRTDMTKLKQRIEELWSSAPSNNTPPSSGQSVAKFQFSSTLKEAAVKLQEGNIRVTGSGLALLEPSLPMNMDSKVSIRINKGGSGRVGICYRNKVQQTNFILNLRQFNQGVYMHEQDGITYSDSVPGDNNKRTSNLRLTSGEVVTLSLDPVTRILNYQHKGKQFLQQTAIRTTTTQPVNFCVTLWGDDMSVV